MKVKFRVAFSGKSNDGRTLTYLTNDYTLR